MNVERRRLKYVATLNDQALGEDIDPLYEIEYVDISNVNASGTIEETATFRFEDAPSRARRRVQHGDVIVSCVRTYLQAIAPIHNPAENLIVSTGFAVVRPGVHVLDTGFVGYAMRESGFLQEVQCRSVGVSYPAINSSDLADIRISLPSIEDQRALSNYLDRETARLDELVSAKKRFLALLDEKRRALITRAVARGLDPNVPLRESGIEWLGQIPAHWETERSRWLFRERDERSTTGEEELLTVSHLTGVTPRSEKDVNMFEADTTEGYKICRAGDLAINTLWAWMGAMGVSRVDGIVSPAYNVYKLGDRLDPGYVDALVRLPLFTQEIIRYSKGVWSSRLRLYPEGFFEAYFPVPSRAEQRAIVRHISTETARIDAIGVATERTIALLKERRAALISAAVTGRIEIPEVAA